MRTMTIEDLKDEKTADLIDYVKSINDIGYKELAETAFAVLTLRFRKDLLSKSIVMVRKWGRDEGDAVELTNRVFDRFLKYPRYDHAKCPDNKVDKCFRKYLYGIANKEIIALFKPSNSPYDGSEGVITTLIPENPVSWEPHKLKSLQDAEKQLDEIFAKLTPKHKIIFLTYKQYEQEGRTLPRHLLQELRDTLSLTQNSIRVYKRVRKVKEFYSSSGFYS
jgi:hypothetical protein